VSSRKIIVSSGANFAPGGDVTALGLQVDGIYNGASSNLTLTGGGTGDSRPLVINGTFNSTSSTVTYAGDSDTTIDYVGYENLNISPTITSARAYSFGAGTSVSGNFSINPSSASANQLSVNLGDSLTVSGNIVLQRTSATAVLSTTALNHPMTASSITIGEGTTLNANGSTITLTGSGTPFVLSGTFTPGTSTVAYKGTASTTVLATTYAGLSLNPLAAPTYTIGIGTLRTDGDFVIGDGSNGVTVTLATNNPDLDVRGNMTINANATFAKGSGVMTFRKGSAQTVIDNTASKQDLGVVQISSNNTATTLNLGSDITATKITVDLSQTLALAGYDLTLAGSGTGSGRPLIVNGSLDVSEGTPAISYTGSLATEIEAATYANLLLAPAATVTYTLGSGSSQTVTANDLTIGDGTNAVTVTALTHNPTINVLGNLAINSNALFTKGTGTIHFKKGDAQTLTDNTASKQNLGNLRISSNTTNTSLSLGSSIIAVSLTIDASQTLDLNGSNTVTLTGNENPLSAVGSITHSTGTFEFIPEQASGNLDIPSLAYYNLKLNKANNTFRPSSSAFSASNQLHVAAGILDLSVNDPTAEVLDFLIDGSVTASQSSILTIKGTLTNNGAFTHNNGTVTLSPEGFVPVIITGSGTANNIFFNLTSTAAGKTIKFESGDLITVQNNFIITGLPYAYIKLEGTTASQWNMKFTGPSAVLNWTVVKDAGCTDSSDIGPNEKMFNGGNNDSCWKFILRSGGGAIDLPGGEGAIGGGGAGGGSGGIEGDPGEGSEDGGGAGGGGGGSP
jgi:hypothetical protein